MQGIINSYSLKI